MREVRPGGLEHPEVLDLLEKHVRSARAQSGPGSAHAFDIDRLKLPDISFWSMWEDGKLVAVGAMQRISDDHFEIKSMHTVAERRGSGIGSAMLRHIVQAARDLGAIRLSLETGSWEYFRPARELYRKHGFVESEPFGIYTLDPNSVFMTLDLEG